MSITIRDDLSDGMNNAYYEYWNDLEKEKEKGWYVTREGIDSEGKRAIATAKQMGLYQQEKRLLLKVGSEGDGISLACGTCWDSGIIIDHTHPRRMDFLDFSKHRVFDMAPLMLAYLGVENKADITLIHGNYYEIGCPDEHYDFVVMSMSLMMAEKPIELLREVRRVLKKKGFVVITGEPRFSTSFYFKRLVRLKLPFLSQSSTQSDAMQHYRETGSLSRDAPGANSYTLYTYRKMFKEADLQLCEIDKKNASFWGFILRK